MLENPILTASDIGPVADLLGGALVLRRDIRTRLDAHEVLRRGLPEEAVRRLRANTRLLNDAGAFERLVGVSLRTLQRRRHAPENRLSPEQSTRAWEFAEVLAEATEVLGSQDEAERWLESPALGLDQHRPIDLIATPAGLDLVRTYLGRLRYGVHT